MFKHHYKHPKCKKINKFPQSHLKVTDEIHMKESKKRISLNLRYIYRVLVQMIGTFSLEFELPFYTLITSFFIRLGVQLIEPSKYNVKNEFRIKLHQIKNLLC